MFMHGSWAHLLGNMLFLWIFGNNVEDSLGKVRYLLFYLLGGLAATGVQSFVTLMYASDADAMIPNVGASGAISAVLGGYLVLLPRARVLTIIFFVLREIPAAFFLLVWFGFQLLDGSASLAHPEQGGGVAFFAHIGGFVFGAAAVKLLQQRSPLTPSVLMTFEEHVRAALDSLPPHLAKALDNVAVVIEEQNREEPDLYGLFDWPEYMPAKISIYRRPLVEDFEDAAELEEQIRVTVLHELAHYFGMDEDRLADLGYD